jgi:triosephosphate isomerase
MSKPIIIANWKMNPPTYEEAEKLVTNLWSDIAKNRKTKIIICPPFIWLYDLSQKDKKSVAFGAQDVFWTDRGAFTGEISPTMLKFAGVEYVIIGHSERKVYLGETDEMINKKLKAALGKGLVSILCVGEREREGGDGIPVVVGEQLKKALAGVSKNLIKKVIVAYEPIWAISTMPGAKADTPDNAFRASIFIRKTLTDLFGRKAAGEVKIIYGGSVNSGNISGFIKEGKMEGALVGGASLDPAEFIKIMESAG